ncbi:Phytosulfokines 3 [Acorus gramineus]|uniref:Phytosulfokine n=1 Tax=Acorus gramineus TaxID=55184 RepID=A0AAV9BGZ7_ACOGR|nr:Phytosulfokines 3 [Acorus gramineus]
MSKNTALFAIALLLLVSLTTGTRAGPSIPQRTQQVEAEEASVKEDVCEGVGEDECLMRRTLVAHTDYIYTQGKKH